VQVAVPDAEIAGAVNPAPDELSAEIPAETGLASPPTRPAGSTMAGTIDRGIAVRAALKAGVLGVFIGMIPFLGIMLTGALGVFFYRRENGFALSAALAGRVGGAAGVVAFAINALLITIRIFVFHAQQEYVDAVLKVAQRFGTNAADPDIQASIRSLFTPSGLALTFFFGMVVTVALAAVGGALASLFLRPRNTRM
jgi:hypothetical protein